MLGLRECVAVAGCEPLAIAGDCDLGVGADDEFGGPLAQADFCGSCVGSFGADATEDLLILPADWQIDAKARACRMSRIWMLKD